VKFRKRRRELEVDILTMYDFKGCNQEAPINFLAADNSSVTSFTGMGPRRTYNYGTFIAPPGCSAEEARREVCNTAFQGSPSYGVGSAPAFSAASIRGLEYHISPTGLRLEKQGECIVISKMGDDAARVSIVIVSLLQVIFICHTLLCPPEVHS